MDLISVTGCDAFMCVRERERERQTLTCPGVQWIDLSALRSTMLLQKSLRATTLK